MMTESHNYDVVVVGAGSSGAAAAAWLAAAGMRVALLEERPLPLAGATWVNGIAPGLFERAGLPIPASPVRREGQGRFVATDYAGRYAVDNGPFPLVNIDMRLFVHRFLEDARKAGVRVYERARLFDFLFAGERPRGLEIEHYTSRGVRQTATLGADLFIDASGFTAIARKRVPVLARHTPPVLPADTCGAHMRVCEIRDLGGAKAFLDKHEINDRDVYCRMGVSGGWSTLMTEVNLRHGVVEFISGAIDDGTRPTGRELIADFVAKESWVGADLFGGGGPIPVRRPYDRFTAPGIACLGLSAGQIFSLNGSGVGAGLVAARILADVLPGYDDPGSLDATWRYQAEFMRGLGGILGSYDALRRTTCALSGDEVSALYAAGLMSPANTRQAMHNEPFAPPLTEGLKLAPGAVKAFSPARRFLAGAARVPLLHAVYRRYPQTPSLAALSRWASLRAFVGGDRSDLL